MYEVLKLNVSVSKEMFLLSVFGPMTYTFVTIKLPISFKMLKQFEENGRTRLFPGRFSAFWYIDEVQDRLLQMDFISG